MRACAVSFAHQKYRCMVRALELRRRERSRLNEEMGLRIEKKAKAIMTTSRANRAETFPEYLWTANRVTIYSLGGRVRTRPYSSSFLPSTQDCGLAPIVCA